MYRPIAGGNDGGLDDVVAQCMPVYRLKLPPVCTLQIGLSSDKVSTQSDLPGALQLSAEVPGHNSSSLERTLAPSICQTCALRGLNTCQRRRRLKVKTPLTRIRSRYTYQFGWWNCQERPIRAQRS